MARTSQGGVGVPLSGDIKEMTACGTQYSDLLDRAVIGQRLDSVFQVFSNINDSVIR